MDAETIGDARGRSLWEQERPLQMYIVIFCGAILLLGIVASFRTYKARQRLAVARLHQQNLGKLAGIIAQTSLTAKHKYGSERWVVVELPSGSQSYSSYLLAAEDDPAIRSLLGKEDAGLLDPSNWQNYAILREGDTIAFAPLPIPSISTLNTWEGKRLKSAKLITEISCLRPVIVKSGIKTVPAR